MISKTPSESDFTLLGVRFTQIRLAGHTGEDISGFWNTYLMGIRPARHFPGKVPYFNVPYLIFDLGFCLVPEFLGGPGS